METANRRYDTVGTANQKGHFVGTASSLLLLFSAVGNSTPILESTMCCIDLRETCSLHDYQNPEDWKTDDARAFECRAHEYMQESSTELERYTAASSNPRFPRATFVVR